MAGEINRYSSNAKVICPFTYKKCPFFKTKEQVEEEKEASLIRLKRRYRIR